MTLAELDYMYRLEINNTEKSSLVDIQGVKIDPELPWVRRIENYLGQIKNPYCYLCDGTVVGIRFEDRGADLYTMLMNYFKYTKS